MSRFKEKDSFWGPNNHFLNIDDVGCLSVPRCSLVFPYAETSCLVPLGALGDTRGPPFSISQHGVSQIWAKAAWRKWSIFGFYRFGKFECPRRVYPTQSRVFVMPTASCDTLGPFSRFFFVSGWTEIAQGFILNAKKNGYVTIRTCGSLGQYSRKHLVILLKWKWC